MAKKWGRGGLQFTDILLSDPVLTVLNKIAAPYGNYFVLVQDAITLSYSVYSAAKNFSLAFQACKAAGGSNPRCFFKGATSWLSVNPAKMPH